MITPDEVRQIPLLSALSDERAIHFASRAADLRMRAGDWFVNEGESPAFFGLLSGRFEVVKRYGSTERRLAEREPGAYFGEVPIVLGSPAFAGARALEPSRLLRIEARDFRRLLREDDAIREQILATVVGRIEGLEEETGIEETPPVVVGGRYDSVCHELRDFLARNRRPFEWNDPAEGRPCAVAGVVDPAEMPLVILADGRRLARPTLVELADALGLRTKPRYERYDVVVIGGGPAGLAAAVYGASEGLRTLLLERFATGGQAGTSSRIENYLGFPSGVSGDELAARAHAQAERFSAELIVARTARAIETDAGVHRVSYGEAAANGRPSQLATVEASAIVVATGVSYRKLDAPGLDRFLGTSVFYGAARTEARGMRGCDVILVGGGNSAGQAAMYFSNYARNVTILIRGADLRASMSAYLIDQLSTKENIRVRARGTIVGARAKDGSEALASVTIRDATTGTETLESVDAVFVFIGADAMTDWLPDAIVRDEQGYVCTGRDVLDLIGDARPWPHERDPFFLETSIPGIFAAGDVRHGSIKRVAAGVGEGSMAIALVHAYLESIGEDDESASLAPPSSR